MKRVLLLALVGLAASVALLAEEAMAPAGPAVVVTGSVTFGIGDKDTTEFPEQVQFAPFEDKSATATITAATADEKVSATVDLDLLAGFTAVTKTTFDFNAGTNNPFEEEPYDQPETQYAQYSQWVELGELADWYNDWADETIEGGTASIWTAADITALIATLTDAAYVPTGSTATTQTFDDGSDAEEITLIDPDLTTASLLVGGIFEHVDLARAAFRAALATAVDDAVANILDTAANLTVQGIDSFATLDTFLDNVLTGAGADYTVFVALVAGDVDKLKQAAELAYGFDKVDILGPAAQEQVWEGETALTSGFVTGATLKFNKVFGILDIAYLFGGQHVAAGSIKADSSGHQEDSVGSYSGLTLGLAADVIAGLTAGVGFYIDSNDVADAVSDDWYTLFDESADADIPLYGLTVNAGYTLPIGDMSLGVKGAFGMYDLAGARPWVFSVMPSFSGFGAGVNVEFAYGLGGLMYLKAGATYSIMGISPSVTFHMVNPGESGKNLAWNDEPKSVLAEVKAGEGIGVEVGLKVDVATLVGGSLPLDLAPSVSGGIVLGKLADADMNLAWNAGLSVGLLKMLTVGFGLSSDPLRDEGADPTVVDWDASVALTYSIATIKFAVAKAYNAGEDEQRLGYSLTGSVSF